MAKETIKNFVLDTNVPIHSPLCLDHFQNNHIYIPAVVLEELDSLKNRYDMQGFNAREFIRKLEPLRLKGDLTKGVQLDSGGKLFVIFKDKSSNLPSELINNKNDNLILDAALEIDKKSKKNTILVSKDVNLRLKANMLGMQAEDYYHDKSSKLSFMEEDQILTSEKNIELLYDKKTLPLVHFNEFLEKQHLSIKNNRYYLLKAEENEKKSVLVKIKFINNEPYLNVVNLNGQNLTVKPLNYKQKFLYDALLDSSIKLVFAIGYAGTGKTLLSISAGLSSVLNREYKKIIMTRSHVPMGRDLGYLPGAVEDKLSPWLKPLFDNVEFIIDQYSAEKGFFPKDDTTIRQMGEITLDYLRTMKLIEVEALTFIRGRTFHDSYLIIDEAQNLTPHEVKTIITRAGKNTKIVLTGDPSQIDNPYIDEKDNGLIYAAEKFLHKNSEIASVIYLDKCERSRVAQEASDYL